MLVFQTANEPARSDVKNRVKGLFAPLDQGSGPLTPLRKYGISLGKP